MNFLSCTLRTILKSWCSFTHFSFTKAMLLTSSKCLFTHLFTEQKPILAQCTFWMLLSVQVSFGCIILASLKKENGLRKCTGSVCVSFPQRANCLPWLRKAQHGRLELCPQTCMMGLFPSLRAATFILNPERFSVAINALTVCLQ